jgi:hypothetical protein
MNSIKHNTKSIETYLASIFSVLFFLYLFLPFRFWKTSGLFSQIEPIVIISALSLICCIFLLIVKLIKSNISFSVTWFDIVLFAYLCCLLLQLPFYSAGNEHIYKIVCFTAVYCVFRQISSRLISILFYLLPVLVIVQIIYGYNRLTEPWQGLSDVMGAFYNTGIFGGLVALGFVSCLSLMFREKTQKYGIDKIVSGIIFVPLVIQLIYSQSRAAWLAVVAGTIVLLFPFFRKLKKVHIVLLIAILLVSGMLFSTKLYHLKKDSADGRLLI